MRLLAASAAARGRDDVVRLFRRSAPEAEATSSVAVEVRPAPPADPIELGLLLRTARERAELRLEDVRDAISVPLVDLDALEHGRFETLHTQQAAVVVLFRYAQHLGLEPNELVPVLRSHWPNRGLTVDAFTSSRGITPIAELQVANRLLLPIATPGPLSMRALGLSEATRSMLENGSAKRLFALKVLAPTSAVRRARLADAAAAAVDAIEEAERPYELASGASGTSIDELEDVDELDDALEASADPSAAPEAEVASFVAQPEEDAFGLPLTPVVDLAAAPAADLGEAPAAPEMPAPIDDPTILVSLDQWIEPETVAVPVVPTAADTPAGLSDTAGAETATGPAPLRITAESQRRWGQHLAQFLAERLGLADGQDTTAPPDAGS